MDMSMSSDTAGSAMSSIFFTSHTTPLYSKAWTPASVSGYAGTCIFLILLSITLRSLMAAKHVLELRWVAQARQRRYVVVAGQRQPGQEAASLEASSEAKEGSLITANGVEERVRVVRSDKMPGIPFRLSVDVPRAFLVMIMVGIAYLLMLAVMTMNVGYFLSVVAGAFVGELFVGRYASYEEH